MKAYIKSLLLGAILLSVVLTVGCNTQLQEKNPLSGKTTDERIIMSLENTYPEHNFTIVKSYAKNEGHYYGICKDEDGLEFRVDSFIYNNAYHFGCHDEYLKEVLLKQDYLKKAETIALKNGYGFEYDGENDFAQIIINLDETDIDITNIAQTLLDILNSVTNIPLIEISDDEFSTNEVKYFTKPRLYTLGFAFQSEKYNEELSGDGVNLGEQNSSITNMTERIEKRLQESLKRVEYIKKHQ
ncbi:MAG: hypothetical protein RR768_03255 [Clostridium sp.]